ncbi:hypothetical protein GOODEAATRI_020670 [Goodea atripinnis]|uniref:Uncharacterized protein n=1 Tax=Goodea atripinnis TaxID=208336 RepID=A0ABV0Q0C4_9TELE
MPLDIPVNLYSNITVWLYYNSSIIEVWGLTCLSRREQTQTQLVGQCRIYEVKTLDHHLGGFVSFVPHSIYGVSGLVCCGLVLLQYTTFLQIIKDTICFKPSEELNQVFLRNPLHKLFANHKQLFLCRQKSETET